jgi:hypothetical protein
LLENGFPLLPDQLLHHEYNFESISFRKK